MRRTTIKDVAQYAGVSTQTVTRTLKQPDVVKKETKNKVQKAIEVLNYVPDNFARRIRSFGAGAENKTIGVLAFDVATSPYSTDITYMIEEEAKLHDWQVFLVNGHMDKKGQIDLHSLNQVLSYRPEALIVVAVSLRKVVLPKEVDIPVVFVNCFDEPLSSAAYVPDDRNSQFKAAEYAIARGYKRPACLHLLPEYLATDLRKQGLEQAFSQANIQNVDHYYLRDEDHYRDYIPTIKSVLSESKYDIIICGNDRIALMAYQIALTQSLSIPNQIAIMGYDNMPGVSELFIPELTTVALPYKEMGKEAVEAIIQKRTDKQLYKIACPLIKRHSV